MSTLNHKIDFLALVSVTKANSNGNPLNGNRPRTDYNSIGEISDVCIKRKIRNRMQNLGNAIFVQSEDRCDDGCKSLSERAAEATKGIKDKEEYADIACEKWLDVRSFGQVFAFKSKEKTEFPSASEVLFRFIRLPVFQPSRLSLSRSQIASTAKRTRKNHPTRWELNTSFGSACTK